MFSKSFGGKQYICSNGNTGINHSIPSKRGERFCWAGSDRNRKNSAFGLPIIQNIDSSNHNIQVLILAPTRELVQQIHKQLFRFIKYSPDKLFIESVFGGAPIGKQILALRRPTHILVATPGRLIDLVGKNALQLGEVKTVVLDEADEMLSMGFQEELTKILEMTTDRNAIWLFSATMPEGIKKIINSYMSPKAHWVTVSNNTVMQGAIEHYPRLFCTQTSKLRVLEEFLLKNSVQNGIIFCRTKVSVQKLGISLTERGLNIGVIHGDMLQKDRDSIMRAFRKGRITILIATDIAARGLDIKDMAFVVHYDLPDQLDMYTHRSGRTGRAGKKGLSLCLITQEDVEKLRSIEDELGIRFKDLIYSN